MRHDGQEPAPSKSAVLDSANVRLHPRSARLPWVMTTVIPSVL